MKWLTAALLVVLLHQVARTQWLKSPLTYPSIDTENFYFDRIAALTLNISNWRGNEREKENVAIGVWISTDRILTSFNPFRLILQNQTLYNSLIASALIGRIRRKDVFYYHEKRTNIACGRQVQFLPDEEITNRNLWHRGNCPMHDLMVFRIDGNHTRSHFRTENYTIARFPNNKEKSIIANLFLTRIANQYDQLGAYFKYAELFGLHTILVNEFEPEDYAEVDCDDWLPRNWGYFICIRNIKNRLKMSSSAMLVSDDKLFGVGSFVLFRGEQSVLVFTDVRPYNHHIYNTCTYTDSQETPPKS